MKYFILLLAIAFTVACKPKAATETVNEPVATSTTADSLSASEPVQTPPVTSPNVSITGISEANDSITATPPKPDAIGKTDASGKPYASPKTNPKPTNHECSPNFNTAAKSQGTTHFVYVTGFNNKEFACWIELEKYGTTLCENKVCTVYFLDIPQVKVAAGATIDAATLKSNGIGLYKHDGTYWEINGANKWKRTPGYGYYNTNNHLGG